MSEEAEQVHTNDVPLLPVRIGNAWLAVNALQVVEIVDAAEPMPLPRAPSHVPGLLNLRGTALPILDAKDYLGLGEGDEVHGFPRVVVVSAGDMQVGLPCDVVLGVIREGDLALRPASLASGRTKQYAIGEVDTGRGIATVIDLAALLEAARAHD